MEELLKDEASQEILKQFIHKYIAENLRLQLYRYENSNMGVTVYLAGDYVTEADS